jgi:glycosyltransferase involved in cell wall biosynthesis
VSPTLEIVLPVHNEQRALAAGVRALHDHLRRTCAIPWQITIAENASTDATPQLADELARELGEVAVLHVSAKGRGNALRTAWLSSRADVVAYMDIDLSTDLQALPELLGPLLAGRGDIAIGSRLLPGARVTRSLRREVISRAYNIMLRMLLGLTVADAQCGFKAARRDVIAELLTEVTDDDWFFDTELLYLAQRNRLAVREVPVHWVEDRDSRVAIVATALGDLRGIARLRRARTAGPARRRSGRAAEHPQRAGGAEVAPPPPAPAAPDAEISHDHTLRGRPREQRRDGRVRPSAALAARSRLAL